MMGKRSAIMKLLCIVLCTISVLSGTLLEDYRRDGFIIVRGFSSAEEVRAMRNRMTELAQEYWQSARKNATVFTTDESQIDRQAKSSYFLDSAERVHYFEEKDGNALNKVGHALHIHEPVYANYTFSKKVVDLVKALGYRDPVVPQSMYIFKSAASGSSVTSHQDATFLRTWPSQTVSGLWLALNEATIHNGCLWIRNASHIEPTRRFFVRSHSSFPEMTFTPSAPTSDDTKFHHLDERWRPSEKIAMKEDPVVQWEGSDLNAQQASDLGFIPVPVQAGDLLAFTGTLDHLSLPNSSPHDRHTFQLHIIEGPQAGSFWCNSNWLQYNSLQPNSFSCDTIEQDAIPHLQSTHDPQNNMPFFPAFPSLFPARSSKSTFFQTGSGDQECATDHEAPAASPAASS